MTTEAKNDGCAPSFSSTELGRMAVEAGVVPVNRAHQHLEPIWWSVTAEDLERFAGLVAAAERDACKAACRAVAERYPTDIWPETGASIDCKSAKMARLTAANIEREITERSNAVGKPTPDQGGRP